MKRAELENTGEKIIDVKFIMNKFNCSRGTAIEFMKKHEALHAYYFGKKLVCERQYFDNVINKMNDSGGTTSFT